MTEEQEPSPIATPSDRQLLQGTIATVVGAAVLLVCVVLPAEYGIDITGLGAATGLNDLAAPPTLTFEIRDVSGGNEELRQVVIPDPGEPVPLPNPSVFQKAIGTPQSQTVRIELPPGAATEVKALLQEGKVVLFDWRVEQGAVLTDFHGHPTTGTPFFVRYEEVEENSAAGYGSLVAPFAGQHGWYWLNHNTTPVVIEVTMTGYFDEVIEQGVFY